MTARTLVTLAFLLSCRREAPPPPRATPAAPSTAPSSPAGNPPPSAAALPPPAPNAAFREAAQFLPQGTVTGAWIQSGDIELVNGQQLFQKIDGAAEKYLAYGFRQLARADYRTPGTELAVTAEIYDMGSDLGAFGQYSMLLTDSRDPVSMQPRAVTFGGGGFLGTSQMVFWKGQHLVQLNLTDDSGALDEAALATQARNVLPNIATRIAAALPGATTPPAPPTGFPTEGVVWGGATYLANSVLGVEHSGAGWLAHCQSADGGRYRVAVLSRGSSQEAHATFEAFRASGSAALPGVGDEAFRAGSGATELMVSRKGNTVIAVAGPGLENLTLAASSARLDRLRALVATAH